MTCILPPAETILGLYGRVLAGRYTIWLHVAELSQIPETKGTTTPARKPFLSWPLIIAVIHTTNIVPKIVPITRGSLDLQPILTNKPPQRHQPTNKHDTTHHHHPHHAYLPNHHIPEKAITVTARPRPCNKEKKNQAEPSPTPSKISPQGIFPNGMKNPSPPKKRDVHQRGGFFPAHIDSRPLTYLVWSSRKATT